MAERFTNPVPQFFDAKGSPLAGGKISFFVTGTDDTDQDTFKDASATIPNTNPVTLSTEGRLPPVFLDGTYKVVIRDSGGVLIEVRDPVTEETPILDEPVSVSPTPEGQA